MILYKELNWSPSQGVIEMQAILNLIHQLGSLKQISLINLLKFYLVFECFSVLISYPSKKCLNLLLFSKNCFLYYRFVISFVNLKRRFIAQAELKALVVLLILLIDSSLHFDLDAQTCQSIRPIMIVLVCSLLVNDLIDCC